MSLTFAATLARPAVPQDAPLIHALYNITPAYFDIISIPMPTEAEVKRELEVAQADERRFTEVLLIPESEHSDIKLFRDEVSKQWVVGYLDYKLDYPEAGDATVNLLLVPQPLQNRGLGRRCVEYLEGHLKGQSKRLLASIYGQNPRAEAFWTSLGYTFAIDAKPVLDWYAKDL